MLYIYKYKLSKCYPNILLDIDLDTYEITNYLLINENLYELDEDKILFHDLNYNLYKNIKLLLKNNMIIKI